MTMGPNGHRGRDFTGVIVPMITPLTAEREIDEPAIGRLVAHLLAGGVAGIFALGSSGEGPWLTATQRRQVVEATARAGGGRVPVLAGVLAPGAGGAIEDAQAAAAAGADAVVVTTPYYFAADEATQLRHIEAVAAASALPVVLYNIPQMTHCPLDPAAVQRLAALPNIPAIKDSAGDWATFERFLAVRGAYPRFRVLQGAEPQAARALLAGADGIVPGLGNLVPDRFARMVTCARSGDGAGALALQAEVDTLWELHQQGFWLVCLKYAAALLGFGSGATCGHHDALSAGAKTAIARLVEPYTVAVA